VHRLNPLSPFISPSLPQTREFLAAAEGSRAAAREPQLATDRCPLSFVRGLPWVGGKLHLAVLLGIARLRAENFSPSGASTVRPLFIGAWDLCSAIPGT
jgi:hypothetical protein